MRTTLRISVLLIIILFIGCASPRDSWTDACNPPEDEQVDGEASASVFVWHDLNANGIRDDYEPPFSGIEFIVGYTVYVTGKDGLGSGSEFMPGCACNCWEDITVPDGYRPTTITEYLLTGDNLTYEFGLVKVGE